MGNKLHKYTSDPDLEKKMEQAAVDVLDAIKKNFPDMVGVSFSIVDKNEVVLAGLNVADLPASTLVVLMGGHTVSHQFLIKKVSEKLQAEEKANPWTETHCNCAMCVLRRSAKAAVNEPVSDVNYVITGPKGEA